MPITNSDNREIGSGSSASQVPGMSTTATAQQTVNKNYSLKALRTWKIVATVRDTKDSVIHRDSATTPTLYAADTAAVSLNLTSRYAMYEAKFLTIPDSINSASGTVKQKLNLNRLVLKIDGVTDSRHAAIDIVDRTNVGLAPGTAFGPGGELFMRACFLRDPQQIAEAADRLARYIAAR